MELTTKEQEICVACQECCKWMSFTLDIPDLKRRTKFIEFYNVRGCSMQEVDGKLVVMIPHVCPHLVSDGCAIYKYRPIACREYDGRLDPVLRHKCKLPVNGEREGKVVRLF